MLRPKAGSGVVGLGEMLANAGNKWTLSAFLGPFAGCYEGGYEMGLAMSSEFLSCQKMLATARR
jgi:hypothetical protein